MLEAAQDRLDLESPGLGREEIDRAFPAERDERRLEPREGPLAIAVVDLHGAGEDPGESVPSIRPPARPFFSGHEHLPPDDAILGLARPGTQDPPLLPRLGSETVAGGKSLDAAALPP